MSDGPVLNQIALGYSPFIDRERAVAATRLTVFPSRPDAVVNAGQLLEAIASVWPPEGSCVSLSIASETLLQECMKAAPPRNAWLEIPSFMAVDPAHADDLVALHAAGNTLLLKGRPLKAMPRRVLPCFRYAIADLADDGQAVDVPAPALEFVQSGIRTLVEMEAAFARGAQAVFGWPVDDPVVAPPPGRKAAGAAPGLQVIVELIHRVDREESIEKLEATLKRDPPLAFKLLRYINSPAFGLRVEISSFRHAIMMLGYKRLKRWLALLLVTASKDANLQPVMFAAVRRGLLMEELARGSGDEELRSELFICGVFSLLDRMFHQPFSALLDSIPVPGRVQQALVDASGPFMPYAAVVRAIEGESLFELRDAAETLMMGIGEINRAQLRALQAARELA